MHTRSFRNLNSPLRGPLEIHSIPALRSVMSCNEDGAAYQHAESAALFTPIAAPILRSVDPVLVAKFLREHERYEIEVESKKAEIPSLTVTPYRASIDRALLNHLVFMGEFETIAPNTEAKQLTDEHVEKFIRGLETTDESEVDPAGLKEALVGLIFPTKISDPSARIITYCADVFERLEAVGYREFKTLNPKHTIRILLDNVRPVALKTAMEQSVKVEAGLDKNIRLFIKRLQEDARACQAFGPQVGGPPDRSETQDTDKGGSPTLTNTPYSPKKIKKNHDDDKDCGDYRDSPSDTDVVCLYPPHRERGIKHKLKDCKACPGEEKSRLIKEYFEEKKNERAHRVKTPRHSEYKNLRMKWNRPLYSARLLVIDILEKLAQTAELMATLWTLIRCKQFRTPEWKLSKRNYKNQGFLKWPLAT